ncbi:hypothetical protein [Spirillospora sp. NPDC029432]|uniref:hypothetical protein n=1 Tax=Spirillospora sp. NPDC029432 TaxID=3154599 RepID=UPI0034550DDB
MGLLETAHRPADVLQAAALYMAEEFRPDGFRWIKSRRCFERRGQGGRVERMTLEPSRHNRAGSFVRSAVAQLRVDESDLGDWRTANHLLMVIRPAGALDVLCATSCHDLAWAGFRNTVDLTHPETRVARLVALCEQNRQTVLPWFASTRDPQRLVALAPDALLGPFAFVPDLVEFLVPRGQRGQARVDRTRAGD